jgi:hypothetical protein
LKKMELVRETRNLNVSLPNSLTVRTPLMFAIDSIRAFRAGPDLYCPELRDNPTAMLIRNELSNWDVYCTWVIKTQVENFNLLNSPHCEDYMLSAERRARIVIAELKLAEGIFDVFKSHNNENSLTWSSAIEAWKAVQIEKKAEDINTATEKCGNRKRANQLSKFVKDLQEFKNPYAYKVRIAPHRFNLFAAAVKIHKSKIHIEDRQHFNDLHYKPYLETLSEYIKFLHRGFKKGDTTYSNCNIYLDGNCLKTFDDSGKPMLLFPEPQKIRLSNRGKRSI